MVVSNKESVLSGKLHLSGVLGREKAAIANISMEGLQTAWQQLNKGVKVARKFAGTKGAERGLLVAAQGITTVNSALEVCDQCPVNYDTSGRNLPRTWGCNSLRVSGEALVTGSESLTPEEWLQKLQNAGAKCGRYLALGEEKGKV